MRAIVTVGLPGCGKSTYAAGLGDDYTELNLDTCRGIVCGDATNQAATPRAIFHRNRELERLAQAGRNVVLSDTNVKSRDRRGTIRQLRALGYTVHVVFFNVGERTCQARNAARANPVPEWAMDKMVRYLYARPPHPEDGDTFEEIVQGEDRLFDSGAFQSASPD